MSKDIGILVPLPPDVKAWAEAQAEDIGLNAANVGVWIRMLVHQAWKQRSAPKYTSPFRPEGAPVLLQPTEYGQESGDEKMWSVPTGFAGTDDAWRGPVDDEQGEAV